jgi:hypothetical protein
LYRDFGGAALFYACSKSIDHGHPMTQLTTFDGRCM